MCRGILPEHFRQMEVVGKNGPDDGESALVDQSRVRCPTRETHIVV